MQSTRLCKLPSCGLPIPSSRRSVALYCSPKCKENGDRLSPAYIARQAQARERYGEQRRAYRAANREKILAARRAYYEANRDAILAKNLEYIRAHPEVERRATRNWQRKNPDKVRASKARRRARESRMVLAVTQAQIDARVAYFGGSCWMCRGAFEVLDHVKPLAKGGLHMASNIRPACRSCNARKQALWSGPRDTARFIRHVGGDHHMTARSTGEGIQ